MPSFEGKHTHPANLNEENSLDLHAVTAARKVVHDLNEAFEDVTDDKSIHVIIRLELNGGETSYKRTVTLQDVEVSDYNATDTALTPAIQQRAEAMRQEAVSNDAAGEQSATLKVNVTVN